MVIDMNEQQLNTVAQLRAFLNGTQEVQFEPAGEDTKRYAFISSVVKRLRYRRLVRADKGIVLRYLERTTGYSRQHLTRLVRRALRGEVLAKRYTAPEAGFARTFTAADVALLAHTDALHGTLSGPATKCLMQRAMTLFQDTRYARLAEISVSHLYNLRRAQGYETRRRHWTQTQGHRVPIGVRRAPAPEGRPGFIRIDSVHQGDQDGVVALAHPWATRHKNLPVQKGAVPHQCGGLRHAVRDRGYLRTLARGVSAAGDRGDARQLPVHHPGLSRGQRFGVHQPHGGRPTGEAAH